MDIDIDFPTSINPKDIFDNIVIASRVQDGVLAKHPCGIYFQGMAVDKETNLAAIPFDQADQFGYHKIDFLHLTHLDDITSKQEIRDLIKQEPDWTLLQSERHVEKLFHIGRHYDLISTVCPTSVQELADCLALIRPGKKNLLQQYLRDKERTRLQLYTKTSNYYFKRCHAIAYSLTIVIQLHLIKQHRL